MPTLILCQVLPGHALTFMAAPSCRRAAWSASTPAQEWTIHLFSAENLFHSYPDPGNGPTPIGGRPPHPAGR